MGTSAGEDERSHKQIKRGDGYGIEFRRPTHIPPPPAPAPALHPPDLTHTQTTLDHTDAEENRRKMEKDY